MTNEELKAGEVVKNFGKKHRGHTLWWILAEDPEHFQWLLDCARHGNLSAPADFCEALVIYGNADNTKRVLDKWYDGE